MAAVFLRNKVKPLTAALPHLLVSFSDNISRRFQLILEVDTLYVDKLHREPYTPRMQFEPEKPQERSAKPENEPAPTDNPLKDIAEEFIAVSKLGVDFESPAMEPWKAKVAQLSEQDREGLVRLLEIRGRLLGGLNQAYREMDPQEDFDRFFERLKEIALKTPPETDYSELLE